MLESITLKNITKKYKSVIAVNNLYLEVKKGELFCLLGPSGCGKTTTLRMIAGFVYPTIGEIYIWDKDVTALPPHKRDIGMVFQDYALFPHMTVLENVAFGLKMRKVSKEKIKERVDKYLRIVGLENLKNRLPRHLSGGQQQRVALVRALITEPSILLCDEPLSNLDAKLRKQMRLEIRKIQREFSITTIFVTHDQEEALTIADRIGIMKNGTIVQYGSGEEIYNFPKNRFVAEFIGISNFFTGEIITESNGYSFMIVGKIKIKLGVIAKESIPKNKESEIIVRPEKIRIIKNLSSPQNGKNNFFSGKMININRLGSIIECMVKIEGCQDVIIHYQENNQILSFKENDSVFIMWKPEDCMLIS